MFKLLIDNGMSGLFKDNGIDGIKNDDMIGFLINEDGIIELINSLPINEYYVNDPKYGYRKITKEQALFLYEQLINNQKNEQLKKVL